MADPIMRRRRIPGYVFGLPSFIASFFTLEGVASLVALALVLKGLFYFGFVPALVGTALLFGYGLNVTSGAAHGLEKLPDPGDFDGPFSIAGPALRLLFALFYSYVPLIVYSLNTYTWTGLVLEFQIVANDPIVQLLSWFAVLYFPVGVIVTAISQSFLAVLDPRIGLRIIARLPLQYIGAAALFYVTGGFCIFFFVVSAALVSIIDVLFLPSFVFAVLNLALFMIPMWILGRFIYQNNEHFSIVEGGQDWVPEWPEARPAHMAGAEGQQAKWAPDQTEVAGWGPQQGLRRAADTLAEVPEGHRQIGAPKVEAIEVEGWSQRSTGSGDVPPPPSNPVRFPFEAALRTGSDSMPLDLNLESGPLSEPDAPSDLMGNDGPTLFDPGLPGAITASIAPEGPSFDVPPGGPSTGPSGWPAPRFGSESPTAYSPPPGAVGSSGPTSDPLWAAGAAPQSGKRVIEGIPLAVPPTKVAVPTGPSTKPISASTAPPSPRFGMRTGTGEPPVPSPPTYAPAPAASSSTPSQGPAYPQREPMAELTHAIQQGSGARVLAAYGRCRADGVDITLTPQLELRLGEILARASEFKDAATAYRRAAERDLRGPFAAQAIFSAAELQAQRLGDVPRARVLYQYIIDSYPQDPYAPRARQALSAL